MPNARARLGLCLACKHDPGCIWENASESAILQCEQFEMSPPAEVHRGTRAVPRIKVVSNGYAGLCANCENRETCIYPKPEGGVWRCEEYV